MLLIFAASVYSIKECDSPIEPSDIPCIIKSTWDYGNCAATEIKIYNSTPELIGQRNFTDFGLSHRCNITWNYSERGSYFWNVSNGDSGTIIVEGEKMEFFKLGIFGVFFILSLVFIGFMHKFKEDEGSSVAYGFFSAAILFILGSLTMFGFEVIRLTSLGVELPFDINKMLGLICFIVGIYSAWYSTSLYKYKKQSMVETEFKSN